MKEIQNFLTPHAHYLNNKNAQNQQRAQHNKKARNKLCKKVGGFLICRGIAARRMKRRPAMRGILLEKLVTRGKPGGI